MERKPVPVALMLGGNQGDTLETFDLARKYVSDRAGEIIAISGIYLSAPWGKEDQPWFKNQALIIETILKPLELLSATHEIEIFLGRVKGEKNGPRRIDIDILLYDAAIVAEAELIIPHPRMHLRKFNLEPLSEIAGYWIHPILRQTVDVLNTSCKDTLVVKRMIPDAAE